MYESVVLPYGTLVLFLIVCLNLAYIKRNGDVPFTIRTCFWTTFFTFLTLVSVTIYIVFSLIWILFGLVLRITYGRKFLGLLSDYDAMHGRSLTGRSCHNVLLMAECQDKTLPDEIYKSVVNTMSNAVFSKNGNVRKLFSLLCTRFGYRFLVVREHVDVSDFVKKMKTFMHTSVLTQSDLTKLLMHHAKQPFPFANKFLWDVHVGTQPVHWKKMVPGKKYYPVLFRFHHCLADGVNIFKFVTGVCGYSAEKKTQAQVESRTNVLIRFARTMLEVAMCCVFGPAAAYLCCATKSNNAPLNMRNVDKKGGSVAFQSDELQVCLKKISKIAASCNASFTGVLSAALSASIKEYYTSRHDLVPEHITFMLPKHPDSLGLRSLEPGSKVAEEINFKNEYQFSLVQLPIQNVDSDKSMLNRLDLVMRCLDEERKLCIFRMILNRFTKIHFMVCPKPLLKLSTYFVEYVPVISNIPGTPKMCLGESLLPISDYIFYVSHPKGLSFILTATSYDNRLSLAIGTSLDIKWEELQNLVRGMYKYINVLDQEVDSLNGSRK